MTRDPSIIVIEVQSRSGIGNVGIVTGQADTSSGVRVTIAARPVESGPYRYLEANKDGTKDKMKIEVLPLMILF